MKKSTIIYFIFLVGLLPACKKLNGPKAQKAIDSLKVGLIAYYPFNNSAVDSSGNNNNGVAYNVTSTTDRYGKPNSAFYFDGTDSYIKVRDTTKLRLDSTDFTLNSWINIEAYNSSYGSIIMAKRNNGSGNGWNFGIAGYGDLTNYVGALGVVTYSISGGGDPYSAGTVVLDTNKWHMVTTVYSLSKREVKIYVDGFLDVTTENMASPNSGTTADLYIGMDHATGMYFLKGKLDDLRIYNRALTNKEVLALYILPN
jgi:hypothetical protein